MSQTVHVELGARSYEIRIGSGPEVETFKSGCEGARVLVVTDSNVDALYGEACERKLAERGLVASRLVIPAGEASKNLENVARVYERAIEAGLDRRSFIVALGGGVVGDLAGFAAATYLRGIRYVQAPTTLLAMVDSSVGGKTGVNLKQGKNLVGAFYQPVEVSADLSTLASLSEPEYVSGLAETIKYGVIWDAALFADLEENAERLVARDPAYLEVVVARCCEIKAEVVAVDERDSGVRAILNFGHTLGHALEQVSGYGKWLHGQAVALGMVYAAMVSAREKGLAADDAQRLRTLLERVGLPAAPGREGVPDGWPELRRAMAADKKTRDRVPRFVLAEKLGAVVYDCEVAEDALEATYMEWARSS